MLPPAAFAIFDQWLREGIHGVDFAHKIIATLKNILQQLRLRDQAAENRAIRDKTLAETEAKAQKDAQPKRKRQRKTSAVTGGVSEVAKRLKTVTFAE